jgi:exopolysaccharide production protein ExoZ
LFFAQRYRLLICGCIFATLVLLHIYVFASHPNTGIYFLTDARLLEFWLGMALGELYLAQVVHFPRWTSLALVIAGFAFVLAQPAVLGTSSFGSIGWTILAAGLIVLGTVSLEQRYGMRRFAPLLLMGDASYSIYLSHILALGLARVIWVKIAPVQGWFWSVAGFAAFGMMLVVIAALAVYYLFERPVTRYLQGKYRLWRERGPLRADTANSALT